MVERPIHAHRWAYPEVAPGHTVSLCGAFAEQVRVALDEVTCPDCLRALAEWGQRQGQAACGMAFATGQLERLAQETSAAVELLNPLWHEARADLAAERSRAEVAEQAACGLAFDLGRLQAVAAEAVCEFQEWLGATSGIDAARHAMHRLGRMLEATGQRTFMRDPLWWRLVYFDSLERAGFRTGEDEQVRKLLPGQPAWQRAHGPTLAEEVERLRYERDELRDRLAEQGLPNWERWIGPCIHGRDPWTRCEEGCVEAGELQALAWRVAQLQADADGKKAAP